MFSQFIVHRGTQDKTTVDAAFQTLGPSKAVPAHVLQGQTRTETYDGNNSRGGGAMDFNDATGASGDVQTYYMNGPGGAGPESEMQRTRQTFYDGDTTRQVTTETTQQQFGSTTVTKVRREEVSTSGGGWPSPNTAQRNVHYQQNNISTSYPDAGVGGAGLPTFSVTKFESSTEQPKPGVWAPPGGSPGGLTVSAPEGVHVHQNADQSVTMTIGLGSPRQSGMASPRQRDASHSQYDTGKHVPQFSVTKVTGGNRPERWAPGDGRDVPVLKPFAVESPRWSPTPARKPVPPETAPKPQLPLQPEPPQDELDAVPSGPPPQPHWSHLDPSARDSPITRIPTNPPLIEPMHFTELIRGESFSDEDDYLDSPDPFGRKST